MPEYDNPLSPLQPLLPDDKNPRASWGHLYGSARGLAIGAAQTAFDGLSVLVTPDTQTAVRMEQQLRFFEAAGEGPLLVFPDWETLPYDLFSPHEDIISQRLETLYRLPALTKGILILPVTTLMQRLPPRSFLESYSLVLDHGERLDREALRARLEQAGYSHVAQVMSHGEFAVRGSIIDLYPMGSRLPFRIDLFDDEIESIRLFDPEQQTSVETVEHIRLLPAREFPTDEAAIKRFRQNYRSTFEGEPGASPIYKEVSQGNLPAGIEYYLPLFFDGTQTLFDYLPDHTLVFQLDDALAGAIQFDTDIQQRYEQRRHDTERPILPPARVFLTPVEMEARLTDMPVVSVARREIEAPAAGREANFATQALPAVAIQARAQQPAAALKTFIETTASRTLFVAESAGRREYLLDVLQGAGIRPQPVAGWRAFIDSDADVAITVSPVEEGMHMQQPAVAMLTETQLFGERVQQRRRRTKTRDSEAAIRDLTDLHEGAPVVHEEHGVGRYAGLQKLNVGGTEAEFLVLEYAGGDKLYVPVASLQLISRYTGSGPDNAPLHKLGGDQWQRIKQKAAAKARDVAAELLDIHARRAARKGYSFEIDNDETASFASAFPFEETPDQARCIEEVQADMAATQPMDRVVCGDVGFGKTEVAMRSAFTALQSARQVAVLVPTTLLAQQHYENFRDRFADWPVRIESLSRFGNQKQHKQVIDGLADGTVDIVIGTHKLLQRGIQFKNLGLVIVDEEQRFGVNHKERIKAWRSEVDMLTLTATPIPRTLNMSLSGLRDLSIITTPPQHRHAIKTFVGEWNDAVIREACQREFKRGGQVYFLHNKVETIERTAQQIQQLLPEATVQIAHGQMRERELEQVMLDFYHQRLNILVCTSIIESGIDVPSANTIIINRADKFGLSQLHQLRGRVGRSHHRAYAYLLAPPKAAMTADAAKRLEAIESLEDLGVGFTLATHDLEIRGAGELLGEEQSGQIHEVGFSLYNELLDRAIRALRAGELPDMEGARDHGIEVDLGVPALLPNDYMPDVHTRLIQYKRIASADNTAQLHDLQIEMIDRFGLLPEPAKNLFEVARVKLRLAPLGINKVEVGYQGGRLLFDSNPAIDVERLVQLIQRQPEVYQLDGMEKLRFERPMEGLEERIEAITELLDILTPQDKAA